MASEHCCCDAPWVVPPNAGLDAFFAMTWLERVEHGYARLHKEDCPNG